MRRVTRFDMKVMEGRLKRTKDEPISLYRNIKCHYRAAKDIEYGRSTNDQPEPE